MSHKRCPRCLELRPLDPKAGHDVAEISEESRAAAQNLAAEKIRVGILGFRPGEFLTQAQYLAARNAVNDLDDIVIARDNLLTALDTIRRQDRQIRDFVSDEERDD